MIRVAVIGAGRWGPNLVRNFQDGRNSEVAWVVDLDENRLAQVADRYPDVKTGTVVDTAILDTTVDAVVVATPTSTHYGIAKRALENGKHVLVEKPITTDSGQAEELCELAAERQRVLMVGHVFVFNRAVRTVKQYLEEQRCGPLYYISMVRTNLGPIRVDVNAAWDLAAHDISIANYWLGRGPDSVSATGGTWINPGIEDAIFATLRYRDCVRATQGDGVRATQAGDGVRATQAGDGVRATQAGIPAGPGVMVHLHCSWLHPRKAREITVVGADRMLTVDDMNLVEPIRLHDRGVTSSQTPIPYLETFASFRASVREGEITIPHVALGEPLKDECDEFLASIRRGEAPHANGRDGVEVVRALEALDRSIANGGCEEPVRR